MGNWTSSNIEKFKIIIDAKKRGFLVNGKELTDIFNQVLNRNLTPTNCSSCLNGRYNQLKNDYDNYMIALENEKLPPTEESAKLDSPLKTITKKRSKNIK